MVTPIKRFTSLRAQPIKILRRFWTTQQSKILTHLLNSPNTQIPENLNCSEGHATINHSCSLTSPTPGRRSSTYLYSRSKYKLLLRNPQLITTVIQTPLGSVLRHSDPLHIFIFCFPKVTFRIIQWCTIYWRDIPTKIWFATDIALKPITNTGSDQERRLLMSFLIHSLGLWRITRCSSMQIAH
jgi:hypothetical protein